MEFSLPTVIVLIALVLQAPARTRPSIQPRISAITTSLPTSFGRSWKCPSYSTRIRRLGLDPEQFLAGALRGERTRLGLRSVEALLAWKALTRRAVVDPPIPAQCCRFPIKRGHSALDAVPVVIDDIRNSCGILLLSDLPPSSMVGHGEPDRMVLIGESTTDAHR